MSLPNYQRIPGINDVSRFDTQIEFDAIGLPKDLSSKSVLDIGCNEGAFVIECMKRGADFTLGVDVNPEWVERAKVAITKAVADLPTKYNFNVLCEDAHDFMRGYGIPFNLILCLSVTHLIENPNELVRACVDLLQPGGLLILEINHRLEKEKVELPKGAKFIGKNKDDRSVYHITK